jgi:hypothetical protein
LSGVSERRMIIPMTTRHRSRSGWELNGKQQQQSMGAGYGEKSETELNCWTLLWQVPA